ncbi:unnamed protein product [Cyprideis torosa]|uniref:Uncharacterized protein n=1 Tax=Cyprideis torosa TaxID=163714 RepID=A0A7R8ZSF4_9CRUS|nr:unnamed protein product [Cyprideis torosa]CAG0895425.1 unnamed protein product [Cyprideis torosa]
MYLSWATVFGVVLGREGSDPIGGALTGGTFISRSPGLNAKGIFRLPYPVHSCLKTTFKIFIVLRTTKQDFCRRVTRMKWRIVRPRRKAISSLLILLLLVLVLVDTASAVDTLKCYVCNNCLQVKREHLMVCPEEPEGEGRCIRDIGAGFRYVID